MDKSEELNKTMRDIERVERKLAALKDAWSLIKDKEPVIQWMSPEARRLVDMGRRAL